MNLRRLLTLSFIILATISAHPAVSQARVQLVEAPASAPSPDCPTVVVPSVLNLPIDKAQERIKESGLEIGQVSEESDVPIAPGHVFSERPRAGTTVKAGSRIDLVIGEADDVRVPNVIGLDLPAAESTLRRADLAIGKISRVTSTTVRAGVVIRQRPKAGDRVEEDSSVSLTVSTGSSQVQVPNVVGLTQAAATTSIAAATLVVGTVTTQSSSSVAAGLVISQNPIGGTSVSSGSAVNLVVSSGPAPVLVPNVVGLTQAAATTSITGVGLVVGTVTTQPSATVAAGAVIAESPVAGTSVARGTAVNLVIASAPAPTITNATPNPTTVGTTVTITGTNFGNSQGASSVTFNGTLAAPTSWSATRIVAPVPTGATSGPLVVTVNGIASNGFAFTVSTAPVVDAITWHYDNARSGLNSQETILTPANVQSALFGKVGEFTVDGQIDGQILYLSQVNIPGHGLKNVIYFATENDTVYALDADTLSGTTATVLWSKSLVPAGEAPALSESGCGNINPNGVTATPVIDRGRNAIYAVSMTMSSAANTTQFDRLHALDLTTGDELFGGPTTIVASVPGTAGNVQNGVITFSPMIQHDRSALLEVNNTIYTSWSGQYGECNVYSGWVIAYDADTLAQSGALVVAPDHTGGGIWMGGAGPAADTAGSVYAVTSTDFSDSLPSPPNYPNSVLRLKSTLPLQVGDFFMPSNEVALSNTDLSFGSAGILLLPDLLDNAHMVHHLAVAGGKDGQVFVLDRDNLGGFNAASDNVVQKFHISGTPPAENFATPIYFNNNVYIAQSHQTVKMLGISNALLSTTAAAQSATPITAVPTISSDGNTNGIVWALDWAPGVLYALDATNLTTLYTSSQAGTRDTFAKVGGHFVTPTVANSHVYFGTGTSVVSFGLLAQ